MEWMHHLETIFINLAHIGEAILEAFGILCVFAGIFLTIRLALKLVIKRKRQQFPFIQVRLQFGYWLALALEFQLGADILHTAVAPNTEALIRLAVIALIRTFLNYFLNKELEQQLKMREEEIAHKHQNIFDDD